MESYRNARTACAHVCFIAVTFISSVGRYLNAPYVASCSNTCIRTRILKKSYHGQRPRRHNFYYKRKLYFIHNNFLSVRAIVPVRTTPWYLLILLCDDVSYNFLSLKKNGLFWENTEPLPKCKKYIVIREKIRRSLSLRANLLSIQMRYIACSNGFMNKKVYPFKGIFLFD